MDKPIAGDNEIQPDAGDDEADDAPLVERSRDISGRPSIKKTLLETFAAIDKGFTDQWERSNAIIDYWSIYNCELTSKQFYSGNAQIFVPIVRNAVDARKTRFTNQIFPQSGRHVECVSSDGTAPDAITSLLEYYIRKAKLRTNMMPPLMRNGDVEGQYNIYVGWKKTKRHVVRRVNKIPELDGDPEIENPAAEPVEDIEEETVTSGRPTVEVIHDSDILVLPQTADSISEAIAEGGSVTILRRWGKAKIKAMIKDGAIRKKAGDALLDALQEKSSQSKVQTAKEMVKAAGIQGELSPHAQVYETWTLLTVGGEERLCQAFYGGEDNVLGARRCPLWSDRVPLLSVPVEKVSEAFKGISKLKPCADLQYAANDAVNEAWDSAAYALMPVVMTDPNKNPRVGSMVLSMAAVWETSPQDTQVMEFPQLWQHGFEMVSACKAEVSQTLNVSPAALTQGAGSSGSKSSNQATIAQEQQIDILSTADAVTVVEEGILTPMLGLFLEYDHQHRDKDLTIRQFGDLGARAKMEDIPPVQMDARYQFKWWGVEQARSAQQIQQQIAGMNVIRGIPPEQLNGYKIDVTPIVKQLVENTFGPRLSPLILISPEQQMPVPVEQENNMLSMGFEVPTHEMDDDQQHIQAHGQLLAMMQQTAGAKNAKKFQAHIWQHMQQMQRKQAAQGPQPGQPGVPGGAGPGVAGTPRIGAQPGIPRTQGPPGMISQDQMQDPAVMPRKVG